MGGDDDFGKWTSDFWDNNDYFNGIYSIRVAYISYETSKTVKEKIKRNKKCTVKTKARVTDMYGTMPVEFRGDSDAWSGGDRTIASYEYFVNGVRYTGRDEIFTSLGGVGKTIDVLYDPHDPSNSCTPWGKKADNGTEHIIPIFIVLGVIVVILLFTLLAIRFLNSF